MHSPHPPEKTKHKPVYISCAAEKDLLAKVSRLEQQCKVTLSDTEASLQRHTDSLLLPPAFPANCAKSRR